MPILHSHTHWQALQAATQTKACQRVCLSHPKKEKLKISFPSKNFKNANTQPNRKTFGQLVANVNIDKSCETRTTRTPACNSSLAKWRLTCFYDGLVLNQSAVLRLNFCAKMPPLRQAATRFSFLSLTPPTPKSHLSSAHPSNDF